MFGYTKRVLSFRYAKGVFDLTKWFVVAAFLLLILNYFFATVFFVSGPSMEPNLLDKSAVLVNRFIYRVSEPRRGDLVVVRYPGDPEQTSYVKRVIGLPGETVTLAGGHVLIDGRALTESYLDSSAVSEPAATYAVPTGQYFTMGDNRPVSNDSRYYGAIERRFLLGRVELTVWPFQLYPLVIY